MSPIPKMKSATHFAVLVTICVAARLSSTTQVYGPLGHEIVGAVADERVASTTEKFLS